MRARFFCLCLVCALLVSVPARAGLRHELSEKALIRLQVRAASDADADQAVKLLVRDAVRALSVALVRDAANPDEAFAALKAAKPALVAEARRAAQAAGYDGPVSAEVTKARFPLRVYGGVVVPPGDYRCVRVTLGSGEGRNWWCVVYPDLCVTEPLAADALRERQPIQFYSSIAKTLREWFGGDGR